MSVAADAVVVAGVGVEPFVGRSPQAADELGRAALFRAVADAGVAVDDVDLFVFASRVEHPAVGQRTLLPVGAGGATILNTENACASGTMGVEVAAAYLRAGMARIAAVVGVEKASDLGSSVPLPAWDRLAAVGITHPVRYALEAARYCAETGAGAADLAAIAVKNRTHAAMNPVARFQDKVTVDEVLDSPIVAEPLTRLCCCANADGAAAAVLTTGAVVAGLSAEPVQIRAMTTGSGSRIDRPPAETLTARLARRAFTAAALSAADVDVAEVYDSFVILEATSLESLGRGHPLGASGLAQLAEIVDQLRGRAGPRQVARAEVGLVHTLGGNVRELEANAGSVMILTQ